MEKHQENIPFEQRKPCNRRRNLLLCSLVFLCLIPFYISPSLRSRAGHCLKSAPNSRLYHSVPEKWCPLPNVTAPEDDGLKPSEHLTGSREFQLAVERLSAAVRVPTESFDDNGDVDVDPRWATFDELHKVLEKLFPLV